MSSKAELNKHVAVKAYRQHGFDSIEDTGTQIRGVCPFCNSQKFFVNKESKAWDCKVCGRNGGFNSFLTSILEFCQEFFSGEKANQLVKHRSIAASTLKEAGLGFNPTTGRYCFPVLTPDRKLSDIRIYNGEFVQSTFSCKTAIMGGENVRDCRGIVWLCEGEWDRWAMMDILRKLENTTDVVIAAQGAGTLKDNQIQLFAKKKVYCLYDHDEAGQNGAEKVFAKLKSVALDLLFLHWSDDLKDGFDVRDLYKMLKKNAEETFKTIASNLHKKPKNLSVNEDGEELDEEEEHERPKKSYDGTGKPVSEVHEAYRKWLHIPSCDIIDVLYGTIIANRLDGDPLWLFLVAPPGMTKTEFLQSVSDFEDVEAVSTLTPHSLISGSNISGDDPSLIPKLDGKMLAIKDFTTILNMNQQAREEIFGTLRDAYDGEISKIFGHGVFRHYKSKFGIIAGVTPAIDSFFENESALGERFLRFRLSIPETLEAHLDYLRRATGNVAHEFDMRGDLKALGTATLNFNFDENVIISERLRDKILYLAIFTATLRGTVLRDKFTKEITHAPFMEIGTRLSKQFYKLMLGICMFKRKERATETEYRVIAHVARSTVPSKIESLLCAIYKQGKALDKESFSAGDLKKIMGLPTVTCQRTAEGLCSLRALERTEDGGELKQSFRLTAEMREIIEKSGVYRR